MRRLFYILLSLLSFSASASAQEWALDGYDPVGYFTQGRAVPGLGGISTIWQGKIWHFASEENRVRFEANPRSFAPQFEGHCPVSLANGRKVPGDPRYFVVFGTRLYLTQSARAQGVLRKDADAVLAQAQVVWDKMR